MDEGFHLAGNGQGSDEALGETESQEELVAAQKKLTDLAGPDGTLVSMSKQTLTLFKQFIHAPDNSDPFGNLAFLLDFKDEEERRKVVSAYYEAQRLGMDTNWNIADAMSRAATNRKGAHRNSRVAAIGDWLSHQKYTANTPREKYGGSNNPKSPLSA